MAHTMNEKSVSFPAGSKTCQEIVDAIATLTGWEQDADNPLTLYITEDHTVKIVFNATTHFKHDVYDHGSWAYSNNGYSNPTGAFTIYFHRSKGETVQFLYMYYSSSVYFDYIFAQNEDGKMVHFRGSQGNNHASVYSYGVSTKNISVYYTGGIPSGLNYSLAKVPDFMNSKEVPELFWVWSIGSPSLNNNLVSFGADRDIYRTVPIVAGTADSQRFAFPVADE